MAKRQTKSLVYEIDIKEPGETSWTYEYLFEPNRGAGETKTTKLQELRSYHPRGTKFRFRQMPRHWNSAKRTAKKSATKRISAALSTFLKKQNPAFKKARGVRVQRLKGGVIKFTPEL